MLNVRKSETRGRAEHGWLSSRHTFSFASYHDPRHMGVGPLRVINEDKVQPGEGFGTHAHRDMEIISYVLDGALEHKDSMGTGSVLHYGDVQRMSAGSGVSHSEFNHSASKPVHFLQIWVMPERNGIEPSYEEKHFNADSKRNQLRLIASPAGEAGSLRLHQDARLYASILDGDARLQHPLAEGRIGYVQVVRGSLSVNGQALSAGDALQITAEPELVLADARDAEVLVFDLPQ
ncbi:pirin family protein [Xanthomonas hortorum]|uniref:Pirin family protein n=2 Tax=Xanthomonas hortorum TaxID=56454 RepID=A0A6V7D3B1_9XANT|nr:pirin family protein [Xanthomonas hortorum]MCE4353620.1 pirin family protein [Xanthomonas hortorum pv. pelargonii]MCM5522763.1 pirin family protein [Xanthomonas hortorum pv. pelargonii]MCM5534627.1 pirin family protein [Xanthomonas hortorum pv. pelargonii]MCM5538971.1 pirin family protein [Xanthomonas hortorum pv. pelargonii]MCM5543735.1 pirin family protein [Xanthomonas hortorum pv. pelargonii]